jgi:cold shock CspA family protein
VAGDALRGTISNFDADVGLGDLVADDGTIYPFHCVEIADGTRTIDVGTAVTFELLHKLGRHEAGRINRA